MCENFEVVSDPFEDFISFFPAIDIVDKFKVINIRYLHDVGFIGICVNDLPDLFFKTDTVWKAGKNIVCSEVLSFFVLLYLLRVVMNGEEGTDIQISFILHQTVSDTDICVISVFAVFEAR